VRQCYGGPLPGDADACCHHPCLQGPSRTARDRRKKPSACTRRRRRAPSPWQGWSRCYWRRGGLVEGGQRDGVQHAVWHHGVARRAPGPAPGVGRYEPRATCDAAPCPAHGAAPEHGRAREAEQDLGHHVGVQVVQRRRGRRFSRRRRRRHDRLLSFLLPIRSDPIACFFRLGLV
jgi:hypothetical protein